MTRGFLSIGLLSPAVAGALAASRARTATVARVITGSAIVSDGPNRTR